MLSADRLVHLCFGALLMSGCLDDSPQDADVAVVEQGLSGTLVLRNKVSGMCLESPTDGALPRALSTKPCRDASAQRWRVLSSDDGTTSTFVNVGTGHCLDSNAARQLYTFGCNGGNFQKWFVNEIGRSIDFMMNEQTGLCVDATGGAARTANCNGSDAQRWATVAASGTTTRTKFSGVIDHGGAAFESERVDVMGGSCTSGFTRVTPPQLSHEGHGGCSFDGWENPFDPQDCRAKIRVHDDAGFLRGHCNWAIFEQN